MNNAKHTPGPWKCHICPENKPYQHFITAGENDQIPICRTGRFDQSSAQDARLIAAAPEMLELLYCFREMEHVSEIYQAVKTQVGLDTWTDTVALIRKIEEG